MIPALSFFVLGSVVQLCVIECHIYLSFPEKCLFSLCSIALFHIDYSFLVEMPAITRFDADDKVANLRWLHLFKMHYIPLCWLACHQFYRIFFYNRFGNLLTLLCSLIFNFHFRSTVLMSSTNHTLSLQLKEITQSVMFCVIQRPLALWIVIPESSQEFPDLWSLSCWLEVGKVIQRNYCYSQWCKAMK